MNILVHKRMFNKISKYNDGMFTNHLEQYISELKTRLISINIATRYGHKSLVLYIYNNINKICDHTAFLRPCCVNDYDMAIWLYHMNFTGMHISLLDLTEYNDCRKIINHLIKNNDSRLMDRLFFAAQYDDILELTRIYMGFKIYKYNNKLASNIIKNIINNSKYILPLYWVVFIYFFIKYFTMNKLYIVIFLNILTYSYYYYIDRNRDRNFSFRLV